MKAVDTNVLIRFLTKDDENQARQVRYLFLEVEKRKKTLFVPVAVVLETIWVLESVYDISRQEILDAFTSLLSMPILHFESRQMLRRFGSMAQYSETDLPDLLIAASAEYSGCQSVLTFDKKASRHPLFEHISA